MSRALVLIALVGCRFGFSDRNDAGAVGDTRRDTTPPMTDVLPDTSQLCSDGDGVCLPGCIATDDDCTTTCGDGRCVGNAGELCGNCATDCATTAPVCGNAECQAGEDGDVCPADCGPAAWPWTSEESALVAAINSARTNGVICTGMTMLTAPALSLDTTLRGGAREMAWEVAHHQYTATSGASCNGRTFGQRIATYGALAGMHYSTTDPNLTATQVVDAWRNSNLCESVLMNTTYTKIYGGVARDARHGWVVWLK